MNKRVRVCVCCSYWSDDGLAEIEPIPGLQLMNIWLNRPWFQILNSMNNWKGKEEKKRLDWLIGGKFTLRRQVDRWAELVAHSCIWHLDCCWDRLFHPTNRFSLYTKLLPPSGQSRVIFQVIADMFVLFICFVFGIKTDEFCEGYPHNFTPTPGYWIECSRQSGRGSRRSHGIQEEGSQEDSSPSGDDDDDDDDEDSRAGQDEEENDVGIQTEKDGQRHANGSTSVFTSTDSAGPSDRAGRKVQLVHQHIQVPVDESPLEKKNIATCLPSHNSPSKPLLPFCSFAMEFFFLFFFIFIKVVLIFPTRWVRRVCRKSTNCRPVAKRPLRSSLTGPALSS